MEFTLNGRTLKYVDENTILIWRDNNRWKNKPDWYKLSFYKHSQGYFKIKIGRYYFLHRIIGYLFLGLDIENLETIIDHIDGDIQNNKLENLRIVNTQQNAFNRIKAKGYCFDKKYNKFKSNIKINGKTIHIGHFDTEEEARQAYLDAKKIYHEIL